MLETIKEHPYITAGAVVGGGIILYMLAGSGDGTSELNAGGVIMSGPTPEQVAAGTQLQALQLEAADRQQDRQNQLQLAELSAAAAATAANMEATSRFNIAQLESDTLRYQIAKSVERDLGVSTLEASVASQQMDLEAFRISEGSANTKIALDYEYNLAVNQQAYDYVIDKKTLKNENKANKRATNLGKKVVKAQVKIAKTGASVTKDANTKNLIGGIINGVFGIANNVTSKSMATQAKKKK